jgi:N-acetylglutamate synthase-like GNAT family acetyltransferase
MAESLRKPWTVRSAAPEDLEPYRALLREAGLPDVGLADHFGESFAVVEEGGRILGGAGVETYDSHGLLRSVATLPARQGEGVGASLVRDRIAWAGEQGLYSLFLLTEDAWGFFTRFGFRIVDRRNLPAGIRASEEVARCCPASAAAMRLDLGTT